MNYKKYFLLLIVTFLFSSCATQQVNFKNEDDKFLSFVDNSFDSQVDRFPEFQTYMGIKKDQDKLNEFTEEVAQREYKITQQDLSKLKKIDYKKLSPDNQVSYLLFEQSLKEGIEDFKYRFHNYPVNQMFGDHADTPSFMINMHQIQSVEDAKAYILRIKAFAKSFADVEVQLAKRKDLGVIPPTFVFPKVRSDIQNLLTGYPVDNSKNKNPIFEDFENKVNALKLSKEQNRLLIEDITQVLKNEYKSSYVSLLKFWDELEKKSDHRAGVWKFPDGENFYKNQLKRYTTTDLTAQQIHDIGLKEVDRIQSEMKLIMKKLNFAGSLSEFFSHVREKKSLYYPNNDNGRKAYLDDVTKLIDRVEKKLPTLFTLLPKARLDVKRVEQYREKSAGTAFYEGPAPDGSRPGRYYANLHDMSQMPKYEMEALAFHEALPGHHMQIAIANEREVLPKFRRFGGYTAYSEGWGLYAEWVGKELGYYQDPYSDFGRLSMELWRACRLVVDTGLHYKKWTREEAIKYLGDNTPNAKGDVESAIDRYIVMPGQATAYKIGMLKIVELRKIAEKTLGEKFDVRLFHDEVLRHGAVPLNVLESLILKDINKMAKSDAQ